MTESGDLFLLNEYRSAYGAFFTVCKTFFRACWSFSFYLFRLVSETCLLLAANYADTVLIVLMRKECFFSPFLSAGVSTFDNASVFSNLKEAFIFNLYLRVAFCAFGKFNRCIDIKVFLSSACRTLPFGNAK